MPELPLSSASRSARSRARHRRPSSSPPGGGRGPSAASSPPRRAAPASLAPWRGRTATRSLAGRLPHGCGCTLEPGPRVLDPAAEPIEDLGRAVAPAEPEGEAGGQGQRADDADQQRVDQRRRDAELVHGHHDRERPYRDLGDGREHSGLLKPASAVVPRTSRDERVGGEPADHQHDERDEQVGQPEQELLEHHRDRRQAEQVEGDDQGDQPDEPLHHSRDEPSRRPGARPCSARSRRSRSGGRDR